MKDARRDFTVGQFERKKITGFYPPVRLLHIFCGWFMLYSQFSLGVLGAPHLSVLLEFDYNAGNWIFFSVSSVSTRVSTLRFVLRWMRFCTQIRRGSRMTTTRIEWGYFLSWQSDPSISRRVAMEFASSGARFLENASPASRMKTKVFRESVYILVVCS